MGGKGKGKEPDPDGGVGSGSVLMTNGSKCGSGRPKTYGSPGSGCGSGTLINCVDRRPSSLASPDQGEPPGAAPPHTPHLLALSTSCPLPFNFALGARDSAALPLAHYQSATFLIFSKSCSRNHKMYTRVSQKTQHCGCASFSHSLMSLESQYDNKNFFFH
jgi:hypothetical protein